MWRGRLFGRWWRNLLTPALREQTIPSLWIRPTRLGREMWEAIESWCRHIIPYRNGTACATVIL